MRQFILAICATSLIGCATPAVQVETAGRHEIGRSYSIATTRTWTRFDGLGWETRTIDGPALGRLSTWAAVADGQPLAEKEGGNPPRYRSGFTAVEVSELVADTVEFWSTGADVTVRDLQPRPFGSLPGFRFAYEYADKGLPTRGVAVGAIDTRKQLHLMLFEAPADYYFDRYQPEVSRIFDSVVAPL